MSTSAEMDEIFRQSVIEVIRRFSPEKKNIVVPPECLKELKEVVRANVSFFFLFFKEKTTVIL